MKYCIDMLYPTRRGTCCICKCRTPDMVKLVRRFIMNQHQHYHTSRFTDPRKPRRICAECLRLLIEAALGSRKALRLLKKGMTP